MKIYNISDTKRFFEVISKCNGKVDLVREDGSRTDLSESIPVLNEVCRKSVIDEIELTFTDANDVCTMVEYLAAS